MSVHYKAWWVVLVGLMVMLAAPTAWSDTRPITVTITATDPDGNPIPDMPLHCLTNVGAAFGITDINGQLILVLSAQENEHQLITQLWDGAMHKNLTINQRILAEARFEELRQQHSFKPVYLTTLAAGTDQYTVSIETKPAIRIRGRLVNAQGEPIAGGIGAAYAIAYDSVAVEDEGVFEFGGVHKGAAALLLAQYTTQVHIIEISAAQTLQDLDLGDVVLVDAPADAPVRITMQNQEYLFDSTGASLGLTVSIVSTNGTIVMGFPADLEGNVIRELFYVPPRFPCSLPASTTSCRAMLVYRAAWRCTSLSARVVRHSSTLPVCRRSPRSRA